MKDDENWQHCSTGAAERKKRRKTPQERFSYSRGGQMLLRFSNIYPQKKTSSSLE